MSFLWLRVGGASITKSWFLRHLRGTTTKDVIAGVKILRSRIGHWRGPVGWRPRCCRLTTKKEKEGRTWKRSRQQPWGNMCQRSHKTGMSLTSAKVFDWWMLLVSQTSCSFCLSWDSVSCTELREASTEEQEDEVSVEIWIHNHVWFQFVQTCLGFCSFTYITNVYEPSLAVCIFACIWFSDLVATWCRCPAGFSCSQATVWQ